MKLVQDAFGWQVRLLNESDDRKLLGDDASITALSQTFGMTLTGMKKHVGVMEQSRHDGAMIGQEKGPRARPRGPAAGSFAAFVGCHKIIEHVADRFRFILYGQQIA